MAENDPLENDSSTLAQDTISEPGVIEKPTERPSETSGEIPGESPGADSRPPTGGVPEANFATATENTIRAPGSGADQKTFETTPVEKTPLEVAPTVSTTEANPDFSPASLLEDIWFYSRDIPQGYKALWEARESLRIEREIEIFRENLATNLVNKPMTDRAIATLG